MNWRRRDHGGPSTGSPDAPTTGDSAVPPPSGSAGAGAEEAAPGGPSPRTLPTPDLGEMVSEEPAPVDPNEAVVFAVTNQKGGVGKTTTTVSLGAALAADGHDVLIVDLDPQGNATTGLGLRVVEGAPSTYRVIVEKMAIEDAAEPTAVRHLHIVPSSLDLAGAEIELVPQYSRETRLQVALDRVRDQYDVVLVDCPPSLGLLTVNALVAADQVLVPIQCEYYALEGLGQLMRTIEMVRSGLNHDLSLGGVLMTMYDARTNLSQQVVDEVRAHFGELTFGTVIPRTVRLSEAPSYGQPITEFDPSSRGARAYQRLAREVARRLGLSGGGDEPLSPLDALLGPAPPVATSDAESASEDVRESPESLEAGTATVPTPGQQGSGPGPHSGVSSQRTDGSVSEPSDAAPRRAGPAEPFHVDHPSTTPSHTEEGPSWQM